MHDAHLPKNSLPVVKIQMYLSERLQPSPFLIPYCL